MTTTQSAGEVLDRHFLEIRCRILDLAANLDRIARADEEDGVSGDARMALIRQGLEILLTEGFDRAERVQLLFSDPYVENWSKRS